MIYLALIAFVLCCFFYQSLLQKKDERIFWLCAALTLSVMVFRSYDPTLVNYQDDVPNYIKFYKNLPSSIYGTPRDTTFGFEPGLPLVCWLLWLFPKSDFFFVLMMRLICMAPVFYGIYRYSSHKELSLLLFIILPGCWLLEMITMRQALATSFLLWALVIYLGRPDHWKIWAALMAVLGLLSHSTSFLVLFFAALALMLPFNKKACYVLLGVAALSGGFFAEKIASGISLIFAPFGLMERVMSYITDGTETGSMNYVNFLSLGFFGALCVFDYGGEDKKKETFLKLFVTGIVIYCLLGNYPLVDRMVSFFLIAGAFGAIPDFPSGGEVHISTNWWLSIAVCFVFIYLFYRNNCGPESYFFPYHFLLDRPLLWMYQ